jgi:uncharacterized protein YpuA (DUF1002 family)
MLIAMGIADACRRLTRFLWIPLVVAPIAVAGTAALAGLWHLGDIALLLTAVAASVGWLVLSARTERTGSRVGSSGHIRRGGLSAECVVGLGI